MFCERCFNFTSLEPQHDICRGLDESPRRHKVCGRAQRHHYTPRAAAQILLRDCRDFTEGIREDERRFTAVRLPQHVIVAVFCELVHAIVDVF